MIALPLSILALAAGVYLLIKVNREYLGGIFKFFAWLIIILSILTIGGIVRHAIHHHHMRKMHQMDGCQRDWGMRGCDDNKEMQSCPMHNAGNCCGMGKDTVCPMSGCKMVGDSVILDRAACEKMMGKEACDKLCKDRGQCIMTKDECAKMCGGEKACCKGDNKDTKSCCKKKGE
jgi:hypothetical protein